VRLGKNLISPAFSFLGKDSGVPNAAWCTFLLFHTPEDVKRRQDSYARLLQGNHILDEPVVDVPAAYSFVSLSLSWASFP
jgi:hypothetical protein